MSYLVQMAALAVQNFVSAAAGIAVAIALIRGFARHETDTIGNFWVDLTRGTLYVLLPISFVAALVSRARRASIQNFHPYTVGEDGRRRDADDRAGPGRVAGSDQAARHQRRRLLQRELGAPVREPDAVHEPRADPLIFILGAGLTYTFGHMVKDTRQGWALFWAMAVMFLVGVFVAYPAEQAGNPMIANARRRECGDRRRSRAATWKARRRGSASRARRCSRR